MRHENGEGVEDGRRGGAVILILTVAVEDEGVDLGDQGGAVLHGGAAHWEWRRERVAR